MKKRGRIFWSVWGMGLTALILIVYFAALALNGKPAVAALSAAVAALVAALATLPVERTALAVQVAFTAAFPWGLMVAALKAIAATAPVVSAMLPRQAETAIITFPALPAMLAVAVFAAFAVFSSLESVKPDVCKKGLSNRAAFAIFFGEFLIVFVPMLLSFKGF